jgi:hypothetical protein
MTFHVFPSPSPTPIASPRQCHLPLSLPRSLALLARVWDERTRPRSGCGHSRPGKHNQRESCVLFCCSNFFVCHSSPSAHTHTHTTNLMRLSDRRCSLLPTTGYSQRNLAAQSSEWSSELSSNVSSSVIHHLPAHGRNSVGQMWYEYQHHLCQTPQSVADAPANSLWPTRSN